MFSSESEYDTGATLSEKEVCLIAGVCRKVLNHSMSRESKAVEKRLTNFSIEQSVFGLSSKLNTNPAD